MSVVAGDETGFGRVRRFEDLVAWQKARSLAGQIYAVTSEPSFRRDFGLVDQLRRAAVSIMANIAEGFERATQGDFHRFLSIAKASCGEVRSHLYIAKDVGYLSDEVFRTLQTLSVEVSRILSGLMMSLNRQTAK